ncbi:replication initiator protein A [Streptococcus sp. zg-JUN1979]|uniref:replication initiator protein A n=1 Tax=Streptococcus sp. zg-JUN1979 TaxID=3391450 RepID=UPI0039A552CF
MAYGRISLSQAINSDNFYQIPKVLIGTKYYKRLKAEAKLLFSLLRDRMSASVENARKGDMRFVDDEGDVFIYYTIDELTEDLDWGKDKIRKLKKELIKYGLLDEVRQGLNKANRLYVKNVVSDIRLLDMDFEEAKALISADSVKSDFRTAQNPTSGQREMRSLEIAKCAVSKTKESETKKSKTKESFLEEEEEIRASSENKENQSYPISRKIEQATKYDRDYIFELVHSQLLAENYSKSSADYLMCHFDKRYELALDNMRFARSAEAIADYVFNGILLEYNKMARKQA